MANDKPPRQDHEDFESDPSAEGPPAPISVTTTDPLIESVVDHQSDWKKHPDTTVCVETTQVSEPSLLYVSGVRTVVIEESHSDASRSGDRGRPGHQDEGNDQDRGRGESQARQQNHGGHGQKPNPSQGEDRNKGGQGKKPGRSQGQDQDNNGQGKKKTQGRGQDEDRRDDDRSQQRDRQPQPQPSMTKNLLITAGVALLCGVIGAMGYSYFFESKSDKSSDQSQDKNNSSSKKKSSSKKSGGGSNKESGKESNAQASTSSSIPGFSSAEDADTLKKQIMDLMQRMDRLGERVNRMTRPKDQTPPVLHTLQIKIGELAREMDELASLPAKVRHYDNRLETLQEEIKTIRARIEAMQENSASTGRAGLGLPPRTGAISSGTGSLGDNPTLELGISLLGARAIRLRA